MTVTTPISPTVEPITEPLASDDARRGTILCGVDDSPGAIAALEAATELSRRLGLRLVVVTVAEAIVDDGGRPIESLSTNQAREGARRLLRRLADEARIPAGTECRYDVGAPAEALARAAQDERADVLVIGAGRPRLLRPRAGVQLAVELGAACPCPVVVVPADRA